MENNNYAEWGLTLSLRPPSSLASPPPPLVTPTSLNSRSLHNSSSMNPKYAEWGLTLSLRPSSPSPSPPPQPPSSSPPTSSFRSSPPPPVTHNSLNPSSMYAEWGRTLSLLPPKRSPSPPLQPPSSSPPTSSFRYILRVTPCPSNPLKFILTRQEDKQSYLSASPTPPQPQGRKRGRVQDEDDQQEAGDDQRHRHRKRIKTGHSLRLKTTKCEIVA